MGGNTSTRRVIVEDAGGEDIVTVSEAVVRRLKGQPDIQDSTPNTVNKSVSDSKQQSVPSVPKEEVSDRLSVVFKKDADDFYTQKLKDLQNRNAALQKQTNEEFAKAVKEVEAKFLNVTACPVCEDLQMKVLECYQNNPREILNCSSVVNAFTSCVERARMAASLSRVPTVSVH
ncbi:MICOS complex subunit Mic19-like isoform X2 [Physella acuta]|uniref:MICOS complex subunit Mic19-like isoform X2 n=1 Tax=Physella acuta TaxID=109671 RepID=UPI0027DD79CD|nr:MICOS complex subunit Mic19-like isoform X2 [Physella acuta]